MQNAVSETRRFLGENAAILGSEMIGRGSMTRIIQLQEDYPSGSMRLSGLYREVLRLVQLWTRVAQLSNADASKSSELSELKGFIARLFVITSSYGQQQYFLPLFVSVLGKEYAKQQKNVLTPDQTRIVQKANLLLTGHIGHALTFVNAFKLGNNITNERVSLAADWGGGWYTKAGTNFMSYFLDMAFSDTRFLRIANQLLINATLQGILARLSDVSDTVAHSVSQRVLSSNKSQIKLGDIAMRGKQKMENNNTMRNISSSKRDQIVLSVLEVRTHILNQMKHVVDMGDQMSREKETYEEIQFNSALCIQSRVYEELFIKSGQAKTAKDEVLKLVLPYVPQQQQQSISDAVLSLFQKINYRVSLSTIIARCIEAHDEKIKAFDAKLYEYGVALSQLESNLNLVEGKFRDPNSNSE